MDRPTPEQYLPPLTWWGHTWRLLLCVLISLAVLSLTAASVQIEGSPEYTGPSEAQYAVDFVVGAVAFVLIWWRRRWPVTITVLLTLAGAVSVTAAGPGTLALVSLATRRRYREIIPVGILAIACAEAYNAMNPIPSEGPFWLDLGINAAVTTAILACGMYIGSRRELMWTLEQRAERAETEQALRVGQARTTERARIAREMHDVLAHRISQVSMHAGALAFRKDLSAEEMRESAALIQAKANEALADLRGVLGVLRDPETGELLNQPQPSHTEIPALVAEAREAGMNVEYDIELANGDPLPAVVGRTIYRIVQEGLTNAHKHAPNTLVMIRVSGSPGSGVEVELRNPLGFSRLPAAPGAGLGLVGLRERAELRGGRLEHHHDGTTFVLRGWIPWAS